MIVLNYENLNADKKEVVQCTSYIQAPCLVDIDTESKITAPSKRAEQKSN